MASTSALGSCQVNLTPSAVLLPHGDYSTAPSISITEQSRLRSAATDVQQVRVCAAHSRGNASIKASFAGRHTSPAVLPAFARCSHSDSPPECSPADDASDADGSHGGNIERVVISTTPGSKLAKAYNNALNVVHERYVRGSVKYQFELSPGYNLERTGVVFERGGGEPASETGEEASTAGDEEGRLWTSESYLRQVLQSKYLTETAKSRQMYKEVILRYPSTNLHVAKQPSKSEETADSFTEGTELKSDAAAAAEEEQQFNSEEELYLQGALNTKRQLASEILGASLRAAQLGPQFTDELLSFMPQFIDRIVTEAVASKKAAKNKEMSFNSRARLYISDVKVVELIKWLKHLKLTAPRMGRLISIADESLGLLKSRIQWLRNIYVRGRDLGVIIERYPQILETSILDLNKKVEILEAAGVQRKWLGQVVSRQPKLLTLSVDELQGKISLFVELGLSPEEFGVMVFRFPAIIGHFSMEEMQSKVDYLRQIGIDEAVLVKILASTPQLLGCDIDPTWDRLLRYFYFLRIDISGVRRILGVCPSVFCLSLEENIAPKVKFLRAIDVHEEAVGQLIVDFPAILTYSLDKKIRPVVRFLLEEAGVTAEKVGKVITMRPELIRCSLPNKLLVLVKYLQSKGFKKSQIGGMVEDFPALLMYSVPALHPKFQYLIQVMKRSLEEAATFPRYFSYSLESRIIPRHEELDKKGLHFTLRSMLACSNDVFNSRVAVAEQADAMISDSWEDPEVVEDQDSTLYCRARDPFPLL